MADTTSIGAPPGAAAVSGFILSGGLSRRMGRDKAELRWRRHSLLDHMAQLLSTVANPVRIIGRSDFPDRIPGCGPLGGILTALEVTDTAKNLILANDLPLLNESFLRLFHARLLAATGHILACKIGSDYPLCLGLDRALLPDVKRRLADGNFALRRFIEENDVRIFDTDELGAYGFTPGLFHNVNTPEDWAAAQSVFFVP